MNIIPTRIPDVLIIEPKVFGDARGFLAWLDLLHHTMLPALTLALGVLSAAAVGSGIHRLRRAAPNPAA